MENEDDILTDDEEPEPEETEEDIDPVAELIEIQKLSNKKHKIAAERISQVEKSIAGLTFFVDFILNIPVIKENLPEHVKEVLAKIHDKREPETPGIVQDENKTEEVPLKKQLNFLKTEAANVTKKTRI
jgi:hypothetical protein